MEISNPNFLIDKLASLRSEFKDICKSLDLVTTEIFHYLRSSKKNKINPNEYVIKKIPTPVLSKNSFNSLGEALEDLNSIIKNNTGEYYFLINEVCQYFIEDGFSYETYMRCINSSEELQNFACRKSKSNYWEIQPWRFLYFISQSPTPSYRQSCANKILTSYSQKFVNSSSTL